MNLTSEKCDFKQLSGILAVNLEQDHLTITTTDANFVGCDCLHGFDTLGNTVYRENKVLVLDLEAAEVSG